MFRPAHLEPGQWSRSFEGTGHVATVPNICPYRERYPDSPSTALSQDRLWNLLWWEEKGGAGARPITGVPGPWPRPSVEPCLPPRLNPPPHQPSQASTLRPGRGCTPSCPPPKLSPSPHPGEEQGAEDGRSSKDRSKSDPTHAPGRDRCTEELLLPGQGDTAPPEPHRPMKNGGRRARP